jgi:putative nucleotidyltransferase with HDIG domain
MSSLFKPSAATRLAAKKAIIRHGISFSSQAALVAGIVSYGIVLLSARAIEVEQNRIYVAEQTAAVQNSLLQLANDIAQPLDTGQSLRVQKTITARMPGSDVILLNSDGLVWQFGASKAAALPPLAKDEFEVVAPVNGARLQLGSLVLRQKSPVPAWAAIVPSFALVVAGLVTFCSFIYLKFSLRGLRGLHQLLKQVRLGNYFERTAQVGCSEVRNIIDHFHKALGDLSTSSERARKIYLETALALSKTIEAKDRYTSGHSQRVAVYATEMGQRLGFDHQRMETLRIGALLHDIGKVAVPDNVLLKAGPLDEDEFLTMKKHPMAGDRILAALPGMRDMADIARSHHERWDGKGYPLGAAGDSIPIEGRIVAIADAYDALVTKRSYKPALPVERALAIIEKDAGSHFDPYLAKLFVAMKRNGEGYKACKPKSFDRSPVRRETMGRS